MAGEEDFVAGLVSNAASFGSGAMDILLYVVLLSCLIALGALIWWLLQFKHRIIVRYLTRRGAFIIQDKARTLNKGGVIFWKFLKGKVEAVPPPKKAISITKKGRLFAECYITEDNPEPVWIVDKGLNKKNLNLSDGNFKPVTTQQRALIVSRVVKANSRRGASLWEKIQQIAIPAIMLTMIIIPFVFWGDITKTSTDALKEAQQITEQNSVVAEQNARILAVMAGKIEAGELDIKQDIPPDAQAGGGG